MCQLDPELEDDLHDRLEHQPANQVQGVYHACCGILVSRCYSSVEWRQAGFQG